MGSIAPLTLFDGRMIHQTLILCNISRNILGGNFALVGLPSVGASGAIFGTVGVLWVDLLAHWGLEKQPGKKVSFS